jgi:hypothetical protein
MARTHGLDKRLEEQRMTSTQKQPKHHSHASSTQDSVNTGGSGAPGKPYKSGANVHKGGSPAPGKGGVSVVAGPKSGKKGY